MRIRLVDVVLGLLLVLVIMLFIPLIPILKDLVFPWNLIISVAGSLGIMVMGPQR